jgi:hypothetical protein
MKQTLRVPWTGDVPRRQLPRNTTWNPRRVNRHRNDLQVYLHGDVFAGIANSGLHLIPIPLLAFSDLALCGLEPLGVAPGQRAWQGASEDLALFRTIHVQMQ